MFRYVKRLSGTQKSSLTEPTRKFFGFLKTPKIIEVNAKKMYLPSENHWMTSFFIKMEFIWPDIKKKFLRLVCSADK